MTAAQRLSAILQEITEDSTLVPDEEMEKTIRLILDANRVFLAGAGRSGFAARACANRLMHLGFTSYFVGEPTTPSIQEGDLLIIGSGSGETDSLVSAAKKASKQGAKTATLTIYPDHTIGKLSEAVIVIPGITEKSGDSSSKSSSVQPSGSSFEQLSWLIYDAIVAELRDITKQTDEDMFARHANME